MITWARVNKTSTLHLVDEYETKTMCGLTVLEVCIFGSKTTNCCPWCEKWWEENRNRKFTEDDAKALFRLERDLR